jgi:hypothetical protein
MHLKFVIKRWDVIIQLVAFMSFDCVLLSRRGFFSYWVALVEIEASRGFVGGVLAAFLCLRSLKRFIEAGLSILKI